MRTVIVSGASGNLGQAICKKFLDNNYLVIGTAKTNHLLPFSSHSNFKQKDIDLSRENDVDQFVSTVIEEYKTIDAAILTVGGFAMGKLLETKITDIQKQLQLNFETTFNLARPVFEHMMKQGRGNIFLTGARTGSDMRWSKGAVAYGLSKSLVFRLAELMNEEAKGKDVITTVISPSTIDTPQNRSSMPDADFDHWVKPEMIAEIVFNYCQPDAIILREPVLKVYHNA